MGQGNSNPISDLHGARNGSGAHRHGGAHDERAKSPSPGGEPAVEPGAKPESAQPGSGDGPALAEKSSAAEGEGKRREPDAPDSTSIPTWLIPALTLAQQRGAEKARLARAMAPSRPRIALGEEMVRAAALRAGVFGAAAGSATVFALPIGFPAGIVAGLYAEAELIFSLLALYELEVEGDAGRARLAALWSGEGFAGGAKKRPVQLSSELLERAMRAALPARLLASLEPLLVRALLKRLGLGFVPRLFKTFPLLGAPLAFAFDKAALRALGNASLVTLASLEAEGLHEAHHAAA